MMDINFDAQRWTRVRRDYADWWAGKLDRPLITVTLHGYEPRMPKPTTPMHGFTSFYSLDTPVERIIDAWQWRLEGQRFMGDAFPVIWPNFGAGVLSAFLGCELQNSLEGNTAWFHPKIARPAEDLRLELDTSNPWYRRVAEVVRAADARFAGGVEIGMTDLGGTLDVLSSFRPGEQLLLDLLDCPDAVERLTWEAHQQWWACFDRLRAAMPHNPGYTAWTPIFSEQPYYMLQCDFCYMISPAMFERFVKPELTASCRRLKNAFYHLDGPGQLPHLDSLLDIPELKGVQWVPGAGQPGITHWPEVYRKIHKAGKRIQIGANLSQDGLQELDILADQLGTAKGIILIGGADRKDEDKVHSQLQRYGVAG